MRDLLKTGAKIVTKAGTPLLFGPAVGLGVNFLFSSYSIVKNISTGNYIGAAWDGASFAVDACTFGFASLATGTAKESAKAAAITTVKKAAKDSSKRIGKLVGAQIAKLSLKGAEKAALVHLAQQLTDKVKKDLGAKLAKELATGMLDDATMVALRQAFAATAESVVEDTTKTWVSEGGMAGAKTFAKEALRLLGEKFAMNVAKTTLDSATQQAATEAAKKVFEEAKRTPNLLKDLLF